MSKAFNAGLGRLHSSVLTAGDIRALLVMSNFVFNNERDANTISAIVTLDEYDAAGYARVAVGGRTFAENDASDRWEFDSTTFTFAALAAGTRQCVGMIIYQHVTNDADSIPLLYYDPAASFPFTGNGADRVITPHADGLAHVRNVA